MAGAMGARFLTPTDASHRLGCSAATVVILFDRGILTGLKDSSGRRLISDESVRELLDKRNTTTRAERTATAAAR